MPSRRSILAATAATMAGAGCSGRSQTYVDPADHVDDWHDEPKRGLADPHTMHSVDLSQHPPGECHIIAREIVDYVIKARLDRPENVSGGCCGEIDGHDRAASVHRYLRVDRGGEVVSTPDIGFQTVREAIPRTVNAPDESDRDCHHPVYVVDSVSQTEP